MNSYEQGTDEELLSLATRGDTQAEAAIARRYSRSLYDFSIRVALDEATAQSTTESALTRSIREAAERTPQHGFRAWVFGFARDEALEGVRQRSRPDTSADDAAGLLSSLDERFFRLPAEGKDEDLALWTWQAARAQRPRDYSLLDLALRRRIAPEEIADIASLSRSGIFAVLGRLRGAFEESFSTSVLYFRGRNVCAELSALVGDAPALGPSLRREIGRHADGCATCRETRSGLPVAADVLASFLDVEPAAAFLERIAPPLAEVEIAPGHAVEASSPGPLQPAGVVVEIDQTPESEVPEVALPSTSPANALTVLAAAEENLIHASPASIDPLSARLPPLEAAADWVEPAAGRDDAAGRATEEEMPMEPAEPPGEIETLRPPEPEVTATEIAWAQAAREPTDFEPEEEAREDTAIPLAEGVMAQELGEDEKPVLAGAAADRQDGRVEAFDELRPQEAIEVESPADEVASRPEAVDASEAERLEVPAGPLVPAGSVAETSYAPGPTAGDRRGRPPPGRPSQRAGGWFGDGRRRIWLIVLLTVATAAAAYVGIAIGDSIQSGGNSSAPAVLPTRPTGVREVACGSAPIPVERGSRATLTFDARPLAGYQVSNVSVTGLSPEASPQTVEARPLQGLAVLFEALNVPAPAGRTDQFRLTVSFTRDGDRTVSECTILVSAPAPTVAVPQAPTATASPVRTNTPTPVVQTVIIPTPTPGPTETPEPETPTPTPTLPPPTITPTVTGTPPTPTPPPTFTSTPTPILTATPTPPATPTQAAPFPVPTASP